MVPAQPNQVNIEDIRCVAEVISGLWHSRALSSLQADFSNEKSELSAAGAAGQGLACVSSHSHNPGGPKSCSTTA